MTKITLIDSNEEAAQATASLLRPALEEHNATLELFHDGAEALQAILNDDTCALVITEFRLNNLGAIPLISTLAEKKPHLPSLLLTSSTDAQVAIKAVQAGAYDCLPKSTEEKELSEVIADALAGNQSAPPSFHPLPSENSPSLVGNSRAMIKVYRDLAKLAATPVTVLLRGETGTGKELIAKALHEHGHRSHKPFITINCAAIPDNLLESELFGHEKGAFTGASSRKIGKFEQANGATLFLDEIGDMQPLLQAKMLRVLQERTIQRIGGSEEIPVDVRIIAATHQNLERMVEEGTFRADLLFRLNGATLKLPPLRDRLGDVSLLTHHFLKTYGEELHLSSPRITPAAESFLARQLWPGNVRQLQNTLRQALLKRRDLSIGISDVEELLSSPETTAVNPSLSELSTLLLSQALKGELPDGAYRTMLAEMEKALLPATLSHTAGNLTHAAKLLGITRFTLREKLKNISSTH